MLSLSSTPTASVWGESCENILHAKCFLNNIINRCFRLDRPAAVSDPLLALSR